MKLKGKPIYFNSLLKVFKGLLFFSTFLLVKELSGQVISITSTDTDAAEVSTGPADTASFTISHPGGVPVESVVEYRVTGTSTSITDHSLASGLVTLPITAPGVSSEFPVDISIVDDDSVEVSETIIVTLTAVSSGRISSADNEVTFTISDNDEGEINLSLDTTIRNGFEPIAPEGASPQVGQFRMESDKRNETGSTVLVTFEVTGTATPGPGAGAAFDYDFTGAINGANDKITLPTDTQFRNVNVEPFNDNVAEIDKTVTIRLIETNNPLFKIGASDTATITITDDDCAAGTIAPSLNSEPTTLCNVTSVNLRDYHEGREPTGSLTRFSTFSNPTETQILTGTAVTAAGEGTYYMFYAAGTGTSFCTSPSTELEIIFDTGPSAGNPVDDLSRCNERGFGQPTVINLNDDALTGADAGGTWTYVSGGTGDPGISPSSLVDFKGEPADTYVFKYTVIGMAPCTDVSKRVSIEVTGCNTCAAGTTAPVLNTATATDLCDEDSVNLNRFIVGGAASAPDGTALEWSNIANPMVASDLIPSRNAMNSATYYAVYWDPTNACASPSTQIDLVLSKSPKAGPDANGSACNNPNNDFGETNLDLDDLLAARADAGDWAFTSGPMTLKPDLDNLVKFKNRPAGTYIYTYTTTGAVAPCENDSAVFTITVADCDPCNAGNAAPVLNPDIPFIVCDEFVSSFNDYTNSLAPAGSVLTWSTDSNTENINAHLKAFESEKPPTTGGTYYGFFFDAVNVCASPTLQINLVLNVTPVLSNVAGDERCEEGKLTLTAMASNRASINWYTSSVASSIAGTGSSFTTPDISETTSYYVEATLNGCTSERQEVIAKVQQQPSSGVPQNSGNASACSVEDNGPTILDLDDLISGEDLGSWAYTSGPVDNLDILANNIVNFEGSAAGQYIFTYTTTGAQAPCSNESTVMTITINDCDVDTDMDGLLDGIEAKLGTNPNNADTDGDGIADGVEVGSDPTNPLNTDLDSSGDLSPDEFINALDSNIIDADNDGVVNQLDPDNLDPCIPTRTNEVCDFDEDGISDGDEITNGSDPDDPCDPDFENSACKAEVDLEVLKAVDDPSAVIGETVIFTITVNNLSANKASQVVIGEMLESGFEYVSHSPSTEQYSADKGVWEIPVIDAMGRAVIEITVKILEEGSYTNIAELLDVFQTDIKASNDQSKPITLPIKAPEDIDLAIEKTVLSANPLVNEEVIFTIKVINESVDSNPVINVKVEDVLDAANFEYVDHNTVAGEYNSGSGIWSIPSINKANEVILEIRVKVIKEGRFINTASIVGSSPADGNTENNEATATVNVSQPTQAEVGFLFNQFSPNGDATNDVLTINLKNYETNQEVDILYDIQIFNRYGSLVFEAINKSDSEVWDGTWEGQDSPIGTYFYTMNIDIGNGRQIKKGWVQLIR